MRTNNLIHTFYLQKAQLDSATLKLCQILFFIAYFPIAVDASFHSIAIGNPLATRFRSDHASILAEFRLRPLLDLTVSRNVDSNKDQIYSNTQLRFKSPSTHKNLSKQFLRDCFNQRYSTGIKMKESSIDPSASPKNSRATAVYALILVNLGVFLADKVFRTPFVPRQLYFFHSRWKWWQPLTTCFCHADRNHLSNNLFLLLLFGRSVEDDMGRIGLLFSFAFCGIVSSLVSLMVLPRATVGIGASGAVFGLFAVSTLSKLSLTELAFDWRKPVELAVLGEFVVRQLASEVSTAASGGIAGVNHVAHLSGAAAGVMMVLVMRMVVARLERSEKESEKK